MTRHHLPDTAGVHNEPKRRYYDLFATVLLPDTFVYDRDKHAQPKPDVDKDPLVIDPGFESIFDATNLREWIEGHPAGPIVPVRSAFGGLAMYAAELWLDPRCAYDANQSFVRRYSVVASWTIGKVDMACEHVVMHECFRALRGQHVAAGIVKAWETRWDHSYSSRVDLTELRTSRQRVGV